MRRMILLELKRAFTTKGMIVALIFGLVVAVHHFFYYQQVGNVNTNFDILVARDTASMMLPDYLWGAWLGSSVYLFHNILYFLILPVLATLPFGNSYLQDTKSGYVRNVLTRTERKNYYVAKWCATFLSGGCVALVPLIVNFVLMLTAYSVMGPYPETFHAPIMASDLLADLFYSTPFLYIGVYLILIFIFAGLYATFSLPITWLSDYSFVVLALPFLVILLLTMILDLFGWGFISPQEFLNSGLGTGRLTLILCEAGLLFIFSFVSFVLQGTRERDF